MLPAALGILALLSAVLNVWQWLAARRFPLHRRGPLPSAPLPGLTLLKPLKGTDAETMACLRSWLEQDFSGPVQVLFGVADPEDPVCEQVRALLKNFPERDAQLIVCQPLLGANAKVSTLVHLEPLAVHPIVIVSDADVWAPPDFLSQLAAAFEIPATTLVNCFYELPNPANAAMRWEALAVNADFWSQILQSNSLKPMDFALGAVMAVRRESLQKTGGFRPLLDYLADDYQLGRRIARAGGKIVLSPVVVQCREAQKGWGEIWRHQLRWARTIRVCQPAPYFFSILSNGTLWPLLWWVLGGPAKAVLACFALRVVTAGFNRARLTRQPASPDILLILVKDLLQFLLWLLSFLGHTVTWRGRTYQVTPGGRLVENRG